MLRSARPKLRPAATATAFAEGSSDPPPAGDHAEGAAPTTESLRPYFWMLGGALAFSIMGGFAHGLQDGVDWKLVALSRTVCVLTLSSLLAWHGGAKLVLWEPRSLWVRSVAGSFSVLATFYALTRAPVADVLTLTNMFPVWIAALSWPVLGVRPTPAVWASLGCAVAGLLLIQQPHFREGSWALWVALFSSFTTSVAMMGLHRLREVDPRAVVVHYSGVSLVICLAAAFLTPNTPEASWWNVSGGEWFCLVGVGVSATLGQIFLTLAYSAGAPTKVAVVGLTQVIFAVLLESLLWQRQFAFATLLGITLILAPTAWLMLERPKAE